MQDAAAVDQFAWWRARLDGTGPAGIDINKPMPGYYRRRLQKGGPWVPVAIWYKDGELVCRVGDEYADAEQQWSWCALHAVAKEDAQVAFKTGKWPGDVAAPAPTDHNGGPSLVEEVADLEAQAADLIAKVKISDQATEDQFSNFRDLLAKRKSDIDKERDAKVRPHLTAQREINGEYNPLIQRLDDAAKRVGQPLLAYKAARKKAAEEAARKAAEEENRKRMEEYQRQQAEAARLASEAKANEPPPPPPEMPLFVAPAPVKVQSGGQRGKRTGLKVLTKYRLTDYAAALAHTKDHPDVMAAVEKVAIAQARAGASVPGIEKYEEEALT